MRLLNKLKEDKGSSNTVSFIIIIFFVMIMLISFVDVAVYFNVKNEIRSAAENGARNVALYGGTGGELRKVRGVDGVVIDSVQIVKDSIFSNYEGSSIVTVDEIECAPKTAQAAGVEVYCSVTYNYKGLAGKFGMLQLGGDLGDEEMKGKVVKVKGTSVSEVRTEK